MIYSRQFLVISFLCRKTGLQTLVNFNWKMSRKTLKMDDLLEAVVDDKLIEILIDRLTDRMTERLSLMVKEENSAQTAELETSLTASITSKLETSSVNIANSEFNNLIAPYDERINALEEENKIMRSHLVHLDVYSRSENLVFHGWPESSMSEAASGSTEATSQNQAPTERHYHTEEVIINLCKESLDIELTSRDISTGSTTFRLQTFRLLLYTRVQDSYTSNFCFSKSLFSSIPTSTYTMNPFINPTSTDTMIIQHI